MSIIDCVQLELYTNNIGGIKLEKLHLGVREQRRFNATGVLPFHVHLPA
jgi:hypothetical protein